MNKTLFSFVQSPTRFPEYYKMMMYSGDCDPAYPALNYIADRYEINLEQRYWLSFLYGTNYCVATTFYIFNEFPDYENVDEKRLQRWWDNNKDKLYFQTDRAKVKNFNYFVKIFQSYKALMGNSQRESIKAHSGSYDELYNFLNNIFYFGRFSLFNYIETLNEITDTKTEPTFLDLKESESSRNGLCYAMNKKQYITMHHKKSEVPIRYPELQSDLSKLKDDLQNRFPKIKVTYWNLETVLCAYKKLFWNTRYFGYYIDRMLVEIITMQKNVKEGVDWSVLYDFRREFFNHKLLGELNGWFGIRKERMCLFSSTGSHYPWQEVPIDFNKPYSRKVKFESIGDVYDF